METRRFHELASVLSSLRLTVHEAGELDGGPDWDFRNVTSPFHRLYFVAGGDGHVDAEGSRYELDPGSVWLFPAGLRADYRCRTFIRKGYLSLNVEWIPGWDAFSALRTPLALGRWSPRLGRFWPWEGRPADPTFALSMAAECWSRFALAEASSALAPPETRTKERFAPLLRVLDERLSAKLTVADWIDGVHVSPAAFSREFRKAFGMNPKAFLAERLFHRAATLLLVDDGPLRVLADRLGFDDEYYFSRWFRRHAGLAPSRFRKRSEILSPSSPGSVSG